MSGKNQCGDALCACNTYPVLHNILHVDEGGRVVRVAPEPKPWPFDVPKPGTERTVRFRVEGKRFVVVD